VPPRAADVEQERLGRIGCDLVNRLFVLAKTAQLFDLANRSIERPVAQFLEKLHAVGEAGEAKASLGVIGDSLFLNQALLKTDPATYENGRYLERVYRRLRAQEIQFETTCGPAEIRAFLEAFKRVVSAGADPSVCGEVPGVTLVALTDAAAATETATIDTRVQVLRTFAASIAVMARVQGQATRGGSWSPALVRRVAYDLVDGGEREPDLLLALLNAPVVTGGAAAHLVRCAVLSLLAARRARLPRDAVVEAALVALCHHLPRPPAVPSPAAPAAEDLDAAPGPEDPLGAALALCAHGGVNDALLRRAVAVYEAGLTEADRPNAYRSGRPVDLLARLVALADDFDLLCAGARPDEALRMLVAARGRADPILARVFVNTVGVYPVGTVVTLSSGARAVVIEAPRRREQLARPVVQLLDGSGAVVDLSREDSGHGEVAATVDAVAAGVNVVHFFLL
jgi:HD-GYP domain-containing protein (c-di-GMP phosphodiesterase class II)